MTYQEHPERAQALGSITALAAFARLADDVRPESQFDVSYLDHLALLARDVAEEAQAAAERWRNDHAEPEGDE